MTVNGCKPVTETINGVKHIMNKNIQYYSNFFANLFDILNNSYYLCVAIKIDR